MRLVLGLVGLLAAISAADADADGVRIRRQLRGGGESVTVTQVEAILTSNATDPFSDLERCGIDRSLSTIDAASELSLFDQDQYAALAGYISELSPDGSDGSALTCPFDYEGDVDPEPHMPRRARALMGAMDNTVEVGHLHAHYVTSSCNSMIGTAPCTSWSESEWTNSNSDSNSTTTFSFGTEVKIPCGECVTLDAGPGQALAGATLDLDGGLNIVGKLQIPTGADVKINTKYIFVQGELVMDAPAAGTTTPISSIDSGAKVEITLRGTEEITFSPDPATDNTHLGGETVSAKAFVVAGGKVDVRALDSSCPSWVKLQSIQYGTIENVALGKNATQSSTFQNNRQNAADMALDGNPNSFTHTNCNVGEQRQWWQVDLGALHTISSIKITNRLDCCGGRLHDYDIFFLDEDQNETGTISQPGQNGNYRTIGTDNAQARYVKIQLTDTDCLQLGEVEVMGWLSDDPPPVDVLTVGQDAARCWSSPGSRLLMTSDTFQWTDQHVATVADVSSAGPGTISVLPMPKKKTAADETFGYPDFASEVALLDRSLIIQGEEEDPNGPYATLGGHFIVLHTPNIRQHLEGALLQNMGQAGKLGRYPLHFHMSESVGGSTLAKNVIWKSNQRCIVIHGSHNATVSGNVAYDTKGHCFMLEDGGEWDNVFEFNLGAKTSPLPPDTPRPGETDNSPSTFWITNPSNHFIGNVAAGAHGAGFWFELKLRGPSARLPINQDGNPKRRALGTFKDNTAHSNRGRAGITTYQSGYQAPPGTIWTNIKSYKNMNSGLFQHGTTNINLQGGLLADNNQAARNFHHDNAIYDNVQVIGRSKHLESLLNEGRESQRCRAGGISFQPNEGMWRGTTVANSTFSGFDNECTGGSKYALWVENDQVRNGVFDSVPTFYNNTFDSPNKHISACASINSSPDNDVREVAFEDIDGSLSSIGPGFFVQDDPIVTSFIDTPCEAVEGSCLLFCPDACLRLAIVSVSQALTTRGFNLHMSDGTNTAATPRGKIWFDEKQSHINAPIGLALSAGPKKTITFTDASGQPAWPGYAYINLERQTKCTGSITDTSGVEFVMPEPTAERCDDLFSGDDYAAGIFGWQNFFTGIAIDNIDGLDVVKTTRRKDDREHVSLVRTVDVSCLVPNGFHSYRIAGKIRTQDAAGIDVASDPKLTFKINSYKPNKSLGDQMFSKSWRLETKGDGTWADFEFDFTLPADMSSAAKAQFVLSGAAKREFLVTGWSMTHNDFTESPSSAPSSTPTPAPSSAPTSGVPTTTPPTGPPVTAAPVAAVPTNLAINGLASAKSECWGKFAYKAIDGNTRSINHSCCNIAGEWWMVDLGKDTSNYIDNIVIKNRVDCCGGRLREFHVEVLDAEKNVVFATYHGGRVGNGAVKTFVVNDGTEGRFVRVRFNDDRKDCLHLAEVEVWGYPIALPASTPEIVELALNEPAFASSSFNGNTPPSKSNDGNIATIHHSKCNEHPWWMVDLRAMSFVQDVTITNRQDCCGGRLRNAAVDILDEELNVVDTRMILGGVSNGGVVQKVFNEDISVGRYVRVSMARNDCLHMAEVAVNGYHLEAQEEPPPNVALGKIATQSSTFRNNLYDAADMALDGKPNTFTHTNCNVGEQRQWWQVDLGALHTISSIKITNRLDCCGGRLHDYNIFFLDENQNEIENIFNAGGNGSVKTFALMMYGHPNGIQARYVKIQLTDTDCLQLGEVEVMGWPADAE